MNIETPYQCVSQGIEVKVAPFYDEERSLPDQNLYIFIYAVEFNNLSEKNVQLISRHWIIRNARLEQKHVNGAGVIGEQPILAPGDQFYYTSSCPLDTCGGSMRGHYKFRCAQGVQFDVIIPPFFLRLQDTLSNMNNLYTPIN